jgi:hypothetical protein
MAMQNNPLATLSVEQLKRAVAVRVQIDRLQNQLERISGVQVSPLKDGVPRRKKGKMSAAAKARISKAMKARWARFKAQRAKT